MGEDHDSGVHYGSYHGGGPVSTRVMIAAVVVLFAVVLFILLLHIYARWFWRTARLRSRGGWSRRMRRRFQFAAADLAPVPGGGATVMHKGLDKEVWETLPMFHYTRKTSEEEVLDCAVCLSEFEENEAGRRLPRCNHVFHTDCIDMWFQSHTTCPLCRASVISVDEEQGKEQAGEELLREAAMVGLQGRGGENSVAIQILQDEGSVLLTESAHPVAPQVQVQHHDHLVVNMTPNGGDEAPSPPSNTATVQQSQFPASVLFWGNQTYVSSATSVMSQASTEVATGGDTSTSKSPRRQQPQLVIEVPRRSGGNLSLSACSSQLTSPTSMGGGEGQKSPRLATHLRNLKRLLSGDSRRCESSPDCCEQQQSFHSACQTPSSERPPLTPPV